MKMLWPVALLVSSVAGGAPAFATDTTLTYDVPSVAVFQQLTSRSDSGFTTQSDQANGFLIWGDAYGIFKADPTGYSLTDNNRGETTTISNDASDVFDLTSIDLADAYNGSVGGHVSFTFNYHAGGSTTLVVALNPVPGLQTFIFNELGLDSFTFIPGADTDGGVVTFDNVVLHVPATDDNSTSPAPEPATWMAMVLGFGAIGGGLRSRRRLTKVNFA